MPRREVTAARPAATSAATPPAPRVGRTAAALAADALDNEVTRIAPAPQRPAPKTDPPPTWDDRTDESESPALAAAAPLDTDLSIALPDAQRAPVIVEQSIIIDDDTLTNPALGRELADAVQAPAAHAATPDALDAVLVEMAVLVKYGHAHQAAAELDRWANENPGDLRAWMRVADFELARVDRDLALRRFGALIARFVERGDRESAADVVRRLRRDLPDDPRVLALAQWASSIPGR